MSDHTLIPPVDPSRPTPRLLVWAYRNGIFPMADPVHGEIEWYSPDPRGILPLDAFHEPATVRRLMRSGRFTVTSDRDFEAVIRNCGRPRSADDLSWIDDRIVDAYQGMFDQGLAHTVEARLGDRLVGGLYGVQLGAAFFGESMFIRPELGGTDSSKVCLVCLVRWLRHQGFTLLDTQFVSSHLERFGCVEIDRGEYLGRLADAVDRLVQWGSFEVLDG